MPRHAGVTHGSQLRFEDPQAAIDYLEHLVLKDPTSPEGGVYGVLGQIWLAMGDIQSAKDAFEREQSMYPTDQGTWLYLGLIAELAGHGKKAEMCYSKASSRKFDDAYHSKVTDAYATWKTEHPNSVSRVTVLDRKRTKKWWEFWK